jgi:hypothetical protein
MLSIYKDNIFKGLTRLGIFLIFCGATAGWFVWWQISRTPDEIRGYIYPLNMHGTFVYVSKAQFMTSKYDWLVFVAGFAAIILGKWVRGKDIAGRWEE